MKTSKKGQISGVATQENSNKIPTAYAVKIERETPRRAFVRTDGSEAKRRLLISDLLKTSLF